MSLLTAVRIAACLTTEPPKEDEATRKAGHHFRDREERKSASVAQVVRRADREANGIRFCDGLPAKDDRFVQGGAKNRKLERLDFETDKHGQGTRTRDAANKNVVDDPVADHTIDLFEPPARWRGLLAALRFFAE